MPRVETATPNVGFVLRVLFPPNLAAAAARNAIAVRIEFDSGAASALELLPALAWLQGQTSASAQPPLFLQLTRAQLRELLSLAEDQPVFFWVNRPAEPLAWSDGLINGVSEHLGEVILPTPEPAPQSHPTRIASPRSGTPAAAATPMIVDGSEHYLAITLPSREHPTYSEARELMNQYGFGLETSNRKWWLRDRHKTLNLLAAHWGELRGHFGAQFTANFDRNTARLRLAEVVCAVVEATGGYDVTLALQAEHVSDESVRLALSAGRGYVETGSEIALLPTATVDRLAAVQRRLSGDNAATLTAPRRTVRVNPAGVAEAETLLKSLAPDFQPPATWRARSEALRNLSKLRPAPLPPALNARLRPYQQLGVAWMWHLYRHELGGVLADEMGLGKTVQALALLAALRSADSTLLGSSLVVCPASLVENWRREAAMFTPDLRVMVHHGEDRRDSLAGFADSDLVITSYGTLVRDLDLFQSVEFVCAIADEAQHIKNRRTLNARALHALRARGRFVLTGTPMENSLEDLRSLFEFLMPGYLVAPPTGTRGADQAWFDERLRDQTAPYILRRTKTAVASELPPKIEQTVYCELSPTQAALYRRWQERGERELDALAAAGASEARLRVATLTQLLRLRQICCDPRLLDAGSAVPAAPVETGNPQGSGPEHPVSAIPSYQDSAKLDALRELLEESIDDGHRLLVFSQFTSLLALLRAELDAQGTPYCYLDGTMRTRARQAEVDRFQQSADVPAFLISLKAGGTGLNLTGADTVVHYDPWWNPAVAAQATDRAHRIGQARVVTSYRLICAGTVEEKVLQLQAAKRALLAGVFEASDAAAAALSPDDLRALLR